MQRLTVPTWMSTLTDEELDFIKQFVLHSGSLKKMAVEYDVSYPTVRLRLDRIIQKIEINNEIEQDDFVGMIKQLAVEEAIDFNVANQLISAYRNTKDNSK